MPKTVKKKKLSFIYSQKELLFLKERYLNRRLNRKIYELYELTKDESLFEKLKEIKDSQRFLSKIKRIIAFNNVVFGINRLVYKRERLSREKDYITKKYEILNNKKDAIPNSSYFINTIDELDKRIKKIEKTMEKRNKLVSVVLFPNPILKAFNKQQRNFI
jgi:hypothetical protein